MRLLFLSTVYPNRREPTKGVFNQSLVEALAVHHDVQVVAPVRWPAAWGLERSPRNRVAPPPRLSPVPVVRPTFYYTPKVWRPWYGRFLWLSVRRTLERLLPAFRPEAVVAYWAHPDGEVAVRAARKVDAVAGLIVGGSDILLATRDEGRRQAILRVLESVDAVFTVGSDLRARVLDFGIPVDKVHDFRQGVDTERFCPGDRGEARRRLGLTDETLLLWVGRMVPVKGLETLLEACQRLCADGLRFRLALVGDGPLQPALEAHAAALSLGATVLFAGPAAHHELANWYRAADLTVLSSRSEGIPNVLLESLACGTPFVATRVGSIPELTSDPQRDLAPPGDARALATVVADRLRDPALGRRRPVVRYQWSETAASVVSALESLRRLRDETKTMP